MALRIADDRNRDLFIARPPRRIVSLVPSDTDTLFALGAGDRVVGRTRYCVEPSGQVEGIPACGGTKDVDVDAVLALTPDLVLGNQEENARGPLEQLAQRGALVFVSFPRRVAQGIAHIARLARILGITGDERARDLIRRGHAAVADALAVRAAREAAGERALRVFVPIWMDPLMTIGAETFGADLLALCGADNAFGDRTRRYPLAADLGRREPLPDEVVGDRDVRYPRITPDEIVARAPELVLLPDEPYAFTEADADVFRALDTPAGRHDATCRTIRAVSGMDLFWYGARSVDALPRLRAVVNDARARIRDAGDLA